MTGEAILIVEDSPDNLELSRILLSGAGYVVQAATDAEEALAVLQSFRPALILMDLQLPGMDGLELTRRLKADPATRDIIILAHTAYAMKADEQQALGAGCDGYLAKPVAIRTLLGTIAGYLSGHPAVGGPRGEGSRGPAPRGRQETNRGRANDSPRRRPILAADRGIRRGALK